MRPINTIEAATAIAPELSDIKALKARIEELEAQISSSQEIYYCGYVGDFEAKAKSEGLDLMMVTADTSDEGPSAQDFYCDEKTAVADYWWHQGWKACHKAFCEKLGITHDDPFDWVEGGAK